VILASTITEAQNYTITLTACIAILLLVIVVYKKLGGQRTDIAALKELVHGINHAVNHVEPGTPALPERISRLEAQTTETSKTVARIPSDIESVRAEFRNEIAAFKVSIAHTTDVLYAGQQGLEHEMGQLRERITPIAEVAEAHSAGLLRTRAEDADDPETPGNHSVT
jgi:hypothetical protein